MDLGTIIGLIAGIGIIVVGIIQGSGDLIWFYNLNSILIVVGGTIAATMVALPLKAVGNIFKILKNVFVGEDFDYSGTIEEIVEKAQKSRKDGLLSLEADLPNMREGFFKNRYVGRTFIMPGQQKRKKSVRQKLNAMSAEFNNKNVLIVDDSIVRGTTSKEIVQMAKDAGANKVFLLLLHHLFVFLMFMELICLIEMN